MRCDRCGSTENIRFHDFCVQCRPLPLCEPCETLHRQEVAEEEEYVAAQPCVKRGPYLPIGDTDWVCVTHRVDLVRIAGEWGTQGKRDEMECPVAIARRWSRCSDCGLRLQGMAYTSCPSCDNFRGVMLPEDSPSSPPSLPLHRTEAGTIRCATCDGGGCPDCTDPS